MSPYEALLLTSIFGFFVLAFTPVRGIAYLLVISQTDLSYEQVTTITLFFVVSLFVAPAFKRFRGAA